MDPARIAALLQPFLSSAEVRPSSKPHSDAGKGSGEEAAVLSAAQLQSISTYIDILLRWNARINLTAIRDPEDIVPRHFGESLFAARHLYPVTSSVSPVTPGVRVLDSLADVGSGAGFPGLPIKLWVPQIALTLVESNHKKATFLREVARALTLTDINIQTTRAETLAATFGTVTLRAVERFETILSAASALVAPKGRLALLISSAQLKQAHATLPNFSWLDPTPIPLSRSRVLAIAQRRLDQDSK